MNAQDVIDKAKDKIIGRDAALDSIAPYLQIGLAGLNPGNRPICSVLLAGPPATGKTQFATALAYGLHGNTRNLVRIDCAEYQHSHEVAKLIGAPPGYIGHRETQPIITQTKLAASASDASNISVVLFDEFEKAHESLRELLLGVMDYGVMRLGDNTTVRFGNTVLLFSSNLGSATMEKEARGAFQLAGKRDGADAFSPARLDAHLRRAVAPEFRSRLDVTLVFPPLTASERRRIVLMLLTEMAQSVLRTKCVRVLWKRNVVDAVLRLASGDARHLRRVIYTHILAAIAEEVMAPSTRFAVSPAGARNINRPLAQITVSARGSRFTCQTELLRADAAA